MIWSRVPLPLRSLYPGALWAVKTGGRKEVYLTFDDGPSTIETGSSKVGGALTKVFVAGL